MKKTIIEEWEEKVESVSRAIIRCILRNYADTTKDTTEICIYEQTMSRKNAGKIMTIEEKNKMISLDNKKTKGYEDSVVGFLLANIEWK